MQPDRIESDLGGSFKNGYSQSDWFGFSTKSLTSANTQKKPQLQTDKDVILIETFAKLVSNRLEWWLCNFL